ncbi:DUF4833 domain-containing protein [Stappia taiwanensis]|uniref:DUF4833 domain-containing protein n=1 Tax=Stappia taiwanensis TaxID=992267 RepID=A0A838XTZ7_9HYPH|nr:DUF4833 domain-containing protein [Stappia taiwanensis]MBA4612501.1 DUF4833 domain-containing protein [Stappia taiwanensis]GGF05849.1 hypothetical protein GCM10007285_37160 [Stappia taiwanensis]
MIARVASPSGFALSRLLSGGARALLVLLCLAGGTDGSVVAQEGVKRGFAASTQRARTSVVTEVKTLPVVRPEFPVPNEPNMLFYLQRSTNPNTVIYAARFREDGTLDPNEPVAAYWRRYNTTGERLPLKMIEDNFAFGVRTERTDDPSVFRLYVVSYPERKATLRQVAPGRAELTVPAGGRQMRPVYAYIDVDESGLMPSVRTVSVMGQDAATGKPLVERIQIE